MEKCDECNKGIVEKKKVDYEVLGVNLGKFDAFVCANCGETIFDGKTMVEIEKKAKQQGVWGIAAKTTIGTSGNSLDVKIPKVIIEFLNIKKGQQVIIEPLDKKRFQVIVG
ncbi:hypothetical protein J4232_05740 [Candidatus Woesearchaeota archaeon]|nr:hypothetical protein [Candidatus Woesearchaeota archaeon]